MTILVTGGAGFIGSAFVLSWVAEEGEPVINLDRLTYAGNPDNLASLAHDARHQLIVGDIADRELVARLLAHHEVRAVVHFAAESHVDRSIAGPEAFVRTNVVGTFELLEATLRYWQSLSEDQRQRFRFVHVSTDEVYGSLGPEDPPFTEASPYAPNSPYAASKAAADHLVRAYYQTYGLPAIITNCSNNYGPRQFPEKLIPLCIVRALEGKTLPLYGDGQQVRDWLYVEDHCRALRLVLQRGAPGATYNIGAHNERTNLEVVQRLCRLLDAMRPRADRLSYAEQIAFVADRPGHDRRYAIDARKIERELGWRAEKSFEAGLAETVAWYLDNPLWVERVMSGAYRNWESQHYGA